MGVSAMTEGRARPRLPRAVWTGATALAVFLSLLVLLAWQVRSGRDPALSAREQTAQVLPVQRVLVRRVIRKVIDDKVIVIHLPATAARTTTAPPSPAASGRIVVRSTSAPVAVAAPPAPAPAPVQVAPLVTKTS
jgi:hypothetical protein